MRSQSRMPERRCWLVEAVPPEVTSHIHATLAIPVYSIGAGVHCDGQHPDRQRPDRAVPGRSQPKFVKKYCNVAEIITRAMQEYCNDVRSAKFPTDEHCYRMIEEEGRKFASWIREK